MKNNGILTRILSVILGFILGVAGTIGGVVGVGYYIGSQPLDEAATTIDGFTSMGLSDLLFGTGENNGVLDENYANKYVKDLLSDTASAIKGISDGGTLTDFNEISPKVEELVSKLLERTDAYGIPLNLEEIMTKPLKKTGEEESLTQYFVASLKDTPISGLFTAMGEKPAGLFAYLCYGEEGIDYTIVDDKVQMLDGKKETTVKDLLSEDLMPIFQKVPLAVVSPPTIGDAAMLTISYGREGVTYQIDNPTDPEGTKAEVTMLNVFYEKKDAKFFDYAGEELEGTEVATDKIGYVKFQLPTEEGEDPSYIYLEKPTAPETKYYAYTLNDDDTLTKMTYPKTKLSDIMGNAMGVVDRILLKDVLEGDGAQTNKVLESLCYDKDGNPNSIGQLRQEGGALVDAIPMSAIMQAEDDSPLVMYLLYGHEGIHYKKVGSEYKLLQQFIAIHEGKVYDEYGIEITPASSYTLDETAKTYTVTVGEETITYTYKTSTTDKIKLTNETEVGKSYLYDSKGQKVLFEETVLGDFARTNNKLDTITDHLTVRDIFGAGVEDNKMLKALADSRIGDIGDDVMDIEIATFFDDVSDNKVLNALSEKGSTLNTLSDDINELTMNDIFTESEIEGNSILKTLADKKITELPSAIETLSVEDVLHDEIYNLDSAGNYIDRNGNIVDKLLPDDTINPAAINPTWKYLLKDGDTIHTEYKIASDMNSLIENMKTNVHEATLQELYDDDLVDKGSLDADTLSTELQFDIAGIPIPQDKFTDKMKEVANDTTGTKKLLIGELTVQEMLVYVSSVLSIDTTP